MKFQLAELRNISPSLYRLSDKELPLKISFRLSKFMKRVAEELKSVEEQRIKLVDQFGQKDEKSKVVRVVPEKEEEFQKAFDELLQESCEIEIEPIKMNEIEPIKLSPADLLRLDKIIVP